MLAMLAFLSLSLGAPAFADGPAFGDRLHEKFQAKACTNCHDFFEKKRGGRAFKGHKGRTPDMCVACHASEVTGFQHEDEWFARPGLYTSGMSPRQACEAIKKDLKAEFKNPSLLARELEKHLFEDPRVLWAISGATPSSGNLPEGKKQADLVKGGLPEWKEQVRAWIAGGMRCR